MTLLQAKSPEHDSYSLPSREGVHGHQSIPATAEREHPCRGANRKSPIKSLFCDVLQKLLDNAEKDLMGLLGHGTK